jgi:3-oxoacyl-[acyl-carrier-protein] synthase-1
MASPENKINVAVTGCGLVSSLGLDVANACAAARAGISRASEQEEYFVRSADGLVGGVVCHSVPFLTWGFEGDARLMRLIQGGLEDLARQCPDAPWRTKRTGFYLSLPSQTRLLDGAELVADEGERKAMQEAARTVKGQSDHAEHARRLLNRGSLLAQWAGEPVLKWSTDSGNTGVAEAIQQAAMDLQTGVCELAIVGGVDSYLDEETLNWLEKTGRLKTPNRANGFQPGEACGFLVLANESTASQGGAKQLSNLRAVCLGDEAAPLFSGGCSSGAAMVEVVTRAASLVSWGSDVPGCLLNDLDGEPYRAQEWGLALHKLAAPSRAVVESDTWMPAVSFGNTGAATGAVQACVALGAFERRGTSVRRAGLITASDSGRRACLMLQTSRNP